MSDARTPTRRPTSTGCSRYAGASHSSTSTGDCGGAPSTFPNSPFVRGAVAKLFAWAETGKPPSKVPRIDMETIDIVSVPEVDGVGNATGGVRSPFVDVPLVQYHVQAGGSGLACAFSGTETPLPADVLADRYESVDAYMKRFTTSLDRTIAAGFVLKADRAEILASAREKAVQLLGGCSPRELLDHRTPSEEERRWQPRVRPESHWLRSRVNGPTR